MTFNEYRIRQNQRRRSPSLSIPAVVVPQFNQSLKFSNQPSPHPVPLQRFPQLLLLLHRHLQHLKFGRERGKANVRYIDVLFPHPVSIIAFRSISITFFFRSEAKLYSFPSCYCTCSTGGSTTCTAGLSCHPILYCCTNRRSECIRVDCTDSNGPGPHWTHDSPPPQCCGCEHPRV